jgi:outer membrane protein OmpA-like peptidoglycan-associated protein
MNTRRLLFAVCGVSCCALLLSACASNDPHRSTKTGVGIGAAAGAVIGHQIDRKSGAVVGGLIGAMAGGLIGNEMDQQRQDLEQALEDERAAREVEIEQVRDDALRLTLDSEVSFDFDSARIRPAFAGTLDKLAAVIRKHEYTRVLVVGHTDSRGSEEYNMDLSLRRARAVVRHLIEQGVERDRLMAEGRGESEPRADNGSEAGRQLNRRVEILITPME